MRRYFAEFVVVFIGVALAFAVENYREDLNDRAVGEEYLAGFRQDLVADLETLDEELRSRRHQLENAQVILEFYDGRQIDAEVFFSALAAVLPSRSLKPNRSTMDEVLNSGSLRLIRADVRTQLLELYALYEAIAYDEAHIARDFNEYLYDPIFSSIPINAFGPWPNTAENRRDVRILLDQLTVANGMRLIVINLTAGNGLLARLESARAQVEHLLEIIPDS